VAEDPTKLGLAILNPDRSPLMLADRIIIVGGGGGGGKSAEDR